MHKDKPTLENLCRSKTDKEAALICGVSSRTIFSWRKKLGISPFLPANSGNRLYPLDKDFFSEIKSPEQAYILGFICADGFIHKNGKSIGIYIQERDKDILDQIKAHLCTTSPVKRKIRTSGYGIGKALVCLDLCSRKLVSDLKSLGISNRKSLTLEYPPIPKNLDRHFIRGFFDGDGHIGKRQLFLVGNHAMLCAIASVIKEQTGTIAHIEEANGYLRIRINRDGYRFLNWLYQFSTIHLERKYSEYIKHWSGIPRARVASSP